MTDGNEIPTGVVEVGGAEGGAMVLRRARVRVQRPSNYFAAPASINVTAVRSRANSVAPSAANSPRVRPTAPSAPPSGAFGSSVPEFGSQDSISPTGAATSGDGPGVTADAQPPSAGQQLHLPRPAASEQMRAQFAHATASMERRLASRTQSRQASRMISRRLSPRGNSPRTHPSAVDPIQRNLLQASAALERTKQSEVESPGVTRSGSADVAKSTACLPDDGSFSGVCLKRNPLEASASAEAAAAPCPSHRPPGTVSESVTSGPGEGGSATKPLVPIPRRSILRTGDQTGEMLHSTADASGNALLPVASERRESAGKNKVDEKHAEQVLQGVLDFLKVEEEHRASRIASRIASRAISRNPAGRSVGSLKERTDVTHAAAEELRRRLEEEAAGSVKSIPNKSAVLKRLGGSRHTSDAAAVSRGTGSEVTSAVRRERTELDQKATLLQAAWRGYRTRLWFVSVKLTATFERQLRQTFGASKAFGWRSESSSEADDRRARLMC
ncbi:conserved hypothetical protein [Neospora caninum Liverpool]|uniref:IQ calmodulin-binding motif domain-containing protein n=1 Tax=Neospora caninum (strain Liverpool) TaxID=572307 RepID=F0VCM0_NEOCL|nr:conserved hypothetical protein [Neospora caninum Liverpool]CBZ51709.1 conserved hypothetical protein [Neospora caninum Liverpool]CEL65662.1 TPA: hypothetical protein BN1204_015040 [Neospora caninum Liverpool]|eukprot:XP_003881742.1 conserved hypothetical protein [Neospora caninum Liverpool]